MFNIKKWFAKRKHIIPEDEIRLEESLLQAIKYQLIFNGDGEENAIKRAAENCKSIAIEYHKLKLIKE